MVLVVDSREFEKQDPFIMLADDRLELPIGAPVGGEHPHAGFEIWTFVVDGSLHDQDEGVLEAGDVQWMTAGRGVIHGENVIPRSGTRILQLWIALPEDVRWVEPAFGTIHRASAQHVREPGVEASLYSDGLGSGKGSPIPLVLADVRLDAEAVYEQALPASYNGFAYVMEGDVRLGGGDGTLLRAGQVGWLDRPEVEGSSILRVAAEGAKGARIAIYAAPPQNASIVTHGPFVGGSRADLIRVSKDWMEGKFLRMSELARAARPSS